MLHARKSDTFAVKIAGHYIILVQTNKNTWIYSKLHKISYILYERENTQRPSDNSQKYQNLESGKNQAIVVIKVLDLLFITFRTAAML